MYKRDKMHEVAVSTGDVETWNKYKVIRNLRNLIKKEKKIYFENTLISQSKNPKTLWKELRKVIPSKKSNESNS